MNKFMDMIKANELRIGNYILYKEYGEGDGVIGKVKPGDFGLICGGNDEYHPIPLTPEWLERCGFEKVGDAFDINTEFGAIRLMNNKVILFFFGSEYQLRVSMDYDVTTLPCEPKYLHQIQNLYFALTGEELKVKLP